MTIQSRHSGFRIWKRKVVTKFMDYLLFFFLFWVFDSPELSLNIRSSGCTYPNGKVAKIGDFHRLPCTSGYGVETRKCERHQWEMVEGCSLSCNALESHPSLWALIVLRFFSTITIPPTNRLMCFQVKIFSFSKHGILLNWVF